MQEIELDHPLIEPIRLARGEISATFRANGEIIEAHIVQRTLMHHFATMHPYPVLDDEQVGMLSRYRNLKEVYELRKAGYGSSKSGAEGHDRGIEDDYHYLTRRLTRSQLQLVNASFAAGWPAHLPGSWIRFYVRAVDALAPVFEGIDLIWEQLKKTA